MAAAAGASDGGRHFTGVVLVLARPPARRNQPRANPERGALSDRRRGRAGRPTIGAVPVFKLISKGLEVSRTPPRPSARHRRRVEVGDADWPPLKQSDVLDAVQRSPPAGGNAPAHARRAHAKTGAANYWRTFGASLEDWPVQVSKHTCTTTARHDISRGPLRRVPSWAPAEFASGTCLDIDQGGSRNHHLSMAGKLRRATSGGQRVCDARLHLMSSLRARKLHHCAN
jgi:hypothetical protein